jgi:hypothetical protein
MSLPLSPPTTDTSSEIAAQDVDEIPDLLPNINQPLLHGPKDIHTWEAFTRRQLRVMHLEPLVDCTDKELADLNARWPEEHALHEDIAFRIVSGGIGMKARIRLRHHYYIDHDGNRAPGQTVKELWTIIFYLFCPSREMLSKELRTMKCCRNRLHDYISRALWLRRQLLRLGEYVPGGQMQKYVLRALRRHRPVLAWMGLLETETDFQGVLRRIRARIRETSG